MKGLLKNTDYIILGLAIFLVVIGVLGIYSAGINSTNSGNEYLKQILWLGVSLIVLAAVWLIDFNTLGIIGVIAYPVVLILLVIVLFMPEINGASSWFNLGFFQLQPSELMKIAYILTFAKFIEYVMARDKNGINKWYNLLISIALYAIPVFLIVLQPDFGTAMVFSFITFFMMFKAGLSYKYILLVVIFIVIAAPVIYFFGLSNYQQERILVFLDPARDPLGSGYNAIQSIMAIGSGMIFGTGLTQGTQTQFGYLPVKSTDFIFSVISEEFGFIISILVIIAFVVILLRILKVASTAKNVFGSMVAVGIFAMIFFHLLENIGMTMGLMPITGIPLPFVSYGGSSLLTNFIALGLVLNISARRQKTLFID